MNATRLWTAVILVALTALGVHGGSVGAGGPGPATPIHEFPSIMGTWSGQDVPLTERQYALLESRDVLFREYRREGGVPVLACVAVAGGNRKVAHPPEICYRGQGWKILAERSIELEVGDVTRPAQELRIAKDDREVLVYSWYRVGRRCTPSYLEQQWWGVQEDLLGSGEPSALLRFSAPASNSDWSGADQSLRRFLQEIVPDIERTLDRRSDSQSSDPKPGDESDS